MRLSACRVRMEVRQIISLMEEVRRDRDGGEGIRNTTSEKQFDKGFLKALNNLKEKLKQEVGADD